MGRSPYLLRRASAPNLDVILELLEEAVKWLRGKNTDQWAQPWPDAGKRDDRILQDLTAGKTWIVWDGDIPAGTVTIDTDDPVDLTGNYIWPTFRRPEKALYVRRVITRRSHAGLGLGAGLLDWASAVAQRKIGTPLIRIDVWTDNWKLHAYYRRQGFTLCEFRDQKDLPDYPSRALFERRTSPNGNHGGSALVIEHESAW